MFCCLFSIKTAFAQNSQAQTHYYYIEEASYDLLKPTKTTENSDGTLSLEFADENVTSFFEGFKILSYFKEFEFSRFTSLHKYYLIGLDTTDKENDLLFNNNIVSAEYGLKQTMPISC